MASKGDDEIKCMCPGDFQRPIESYPLGRGAFGDMFKGIYGSMETCLS